MRDADQFSGRASADRIYAAADQAMTMSGQTSIEFKGLPLNPLVVGAVPDTCEA